jgi:hypothetical protein
VHGKSAGNGGLALALLPIFAEPQNAEVLLEGSMSLALTRVLVNFAYGRVMNEDQARHPKALPERSG